MLSHVLVGPHWFVSGEHIGFVTTVVIVGIDVGFDDVGFIVGLDMT
jgi:hypothetical protein